MSNEAPPRAATRVPRRSLMSLNLQEDHMNCRLSRLALLAFAGLLGSLAVGCSAKAPTASQQRPQIQARHFQSPEESVTVTTRLLEKQDWSTLASYYDLSGTNIDIASLTSGEFFMHAHPQPGM